MKNFLLCITLVFVFAGCSRKKEVSHIKHYPAHRTTWRQIDTAKAYKSSYEFSDSMGRQIEEIVYSEAGLINCVTRTDYDSLGRKTVSGWTCASKSGSWTV